MSSTDPDSFAPDPATRGNGQMDVSPITGTSKLSLSSADAATHLISGYAWSRTGTPATVTYAFREDGTPPDTDSSGFQEFNAQQIAQAQKAMTAWSDVANIHFVQVADSTGYSDSATILFGDYTSGPAAGFTVYPGSTSARSSSGDVWINVSLSYNAAPTTGNYGGQTLVHEIGHSIGLSHPSDYDEDTSPTYQDSASYYEDSRQYTVMSYFSEQYTGGNDRGYYSAVPLLDDIAAAQRMYGANMTTRTGDTVYGFNSNTGEDWFTATSASTKLVFAAWDAGGTDTFDFTGYSQSAQVDLREGHFSNVGGLTDNVVIAYGTVIENLLSGAGADTLIGNAANNLIDGGAGNDLIYGEGGNDTLRGGAGDDVIDGGSGTNVIDGGAGQDELLLPGTIGDYASFLGQGGTWSITGNGVTDTITGIETIVTRAIGATVDGPSYTVQDFTARTLTTINPLGGSAQTSILSTSLADFNGDGHTDLLWRNVTGALSEWQVGGNGSQLTIDTYDANVDPSWKVIGTFDFNGDGRSDIMWRNTDGTFSVWNASGTGFTPNSYTTSVGTQWAIAAAGDVNGDHKDDLLWQRGDGAISLWQSTGSGFTQNTYYHASVGIDWKVAGLADVTGDGKADIVWRDDNGAVSVWDSTGTGFTEGSYFVGGVPTSWHIEGLGDFNGDGKADLLWRNDGGAISIWLSTGTGFAQNSYYDASVNNSWHIAAVGDFNADGKSDILWRNDNGAFSTWQSNGTGFAENVASSTVPTSWSVAGHDFVT